MVAYAAAGAFLGLAYFDLYYHILIVIVLSKVVVLKEDQENGLSSNSMSLARYSRDR